MERTCIFTELAFAAGGQRLEKGLPLRRLEKSAESSRPEWVAPMSVIEYIVRLSFSIGTAFVADQGKLIQIDPN